ncbi:HTH domain-containing protein [Halobium salinum]|uniref:HTH domain-containing protein n=1 Tax=Halobium salinum TaxID=1364940 RepID=A0ABD5PAE4_9EURY|nr:HTH domain-containing protein [Halobium salinum]
MDTDTSSERSVTLFLRADPEPGAERPRQRVVERLSALEREGALDEYDVVVWGREIRLGGPLEGTPYYRSVLDRVEEFETWAARTGTSLDPLFQRRTVESVMTDEEYEVLTLPVACLAVYRDDELHRLYPCGSGDGACSVTECLDRLESEGVPTTVGAPVP